MTSKEFVLWLKGFTEGVHEFNITPKQWDTLKEKLEGVNDDKFVETPGMFQVHPQPIYPGVQIGPNGTGTPNIHDLVDRHPWGAQKVWAGNPIETKITTTPGTGYITIANPYIASFGSGSSYNPSSITYANPPGTTTSTAYGYPSGSAWSYTNSTDGKIF